MAARAVLYNQVPSIFASFAGFCSGTIRSDFGM
jgi:hypothetical protein